jgi:cytochrome c oxidase assembly protein subunit 15
MQTDTMTSAHAPTDEETYALRLAGAFGALLALTVGLITLGALVRAHNAGLACPDWPLCFGAVVPKIDLRVGFEWGHRVAAGSISLAFSVLALLALRRPSTRAACAPLLATAAALLVVQILLGALTVWRLLAAWTVTAHLVTGNSFALTLLWIALALRDCARGTSGVAAVSPALRRLVALSAVLLVAQLVLGGLVASRYAGLACAEWPACNGGIWFPSWDGIVGLHLLHRLVGYSLLAALAVTALVSARVAPELRRVTWLALGLGLAQVCVGIANVLLGLPVEMTALHTVLAAGLVLTVSVGVRTSWPRVAT